MISKIVPFQRLEKCKLLYDFVVLKIFENAWFEFFECNYEYALKALTTLADYNVMGTFNTKKRKVLLRIDQNLMWQTIARIAAGAWYESVPNQTFMHAGSCHI